MKDVLIVYESKTGNTEKVALAMAEALGDRCEVKKSTDEIDLNAYKLIYVGYWVDKGMPCAPMQKFLATLENKMVVLFQTLGAEPKSMHGTCSLINAAKFMPASSYVLGAFSARGAIDPKLIEMMRKMPAGHPHAPSPETEARWAAAANHPDAAELAEAKEVAVERLAFFDKFYAK
ncbi:MAG: flavodoxin family protein [Phascolarctobacterium sp.]|nr:flavodoxin family protein [Phascolarctobacterium sp.]